MRKWAIRGCLLSIISLLLFILFRQSSTALLCQYFRQRRNRRRRLRLYKSLCWIFLNLEMKSKYILENALVDLPWLVLYLNVKFPQKNITYKSASHQAMILRKTTVLLPWTHKVDLRKSKPHAIIFNFKFSVYFICLSLRFVSRLVILSWGTWKTYLFASVTFMGDSFVLFHTAINLPWGNILLR